MLFVVLPPPILTKPTVVEDDLNDELPLSLRY
jgi:hypothetical protein